MSPRSALSTRRISELWLYLPLTIAFTWPLALHPQAGLTAPITIGDPYLNLWILGWDLRTLTLHPSAFFTGGVFNANIFYPATNTLAYSDNFLLQALAVWPLYVLTHNLVLCYNVLLFASLMASAMAMHILVRAISGSRWGALMAGLVWGFWPYHFAHLLQIQLQALYFFPLAFWFLHRVVVRRRVADAIGLGMAAACQTISAVYYGVMIAVALSVTSLVLIAGFKGGDRLRLARRLLLAATVGAICVAPVAWPYLRLQQQGFVRTVYEAAEHGAALKSYLWVPSGYVLYQHLGLSSGPVATDTFERQLFPGFVVALLAVVGLFGARRRPESLFAGACALLVALGVILSFGPDGPGSLYATIHRYVFGFQAIRVPARFVVLVAFGLAVLSGFGMRSLAGGGAPQLPPRYGMLMGAALLSFTVLEYLPGPLPSVDPPPLHTAEGEWLSHAPQSGAVIYLPLYPDKRNTPVMLQSLEHGRPIVNGHSGSRPSFFLALVDSMQQFPGVDSLWALHDLPVRYVITRSPVATADPTPLVERARFPDAVIYELVWTPAIEAVLTQVDSSPLPAAGPPPFHRGERAVYDITWETAPAGLRLSAGTVTIAAQSGPPAPAPCATEGSNSRGGTYRLTALAQTAGWVSRFFEAQDCFAAWSDETWRPIVAEQRRREGRRSIDQVYDYDFINRVVRIGGQMALPISAGTHDPLSALFYARTLPLHPGYQVSVPVNESGRNILVSLTALDIEPVQVGGKSVDAVRAEPRLHYRVQTRQPIQIMLWLTNDERHLPLVMTFASDFGSFRAELTSYQTD
ncbi:MAG TPA: DUF3108 domain-containing protein [Vicinamibacterales bacterium]|nr:DUF3108 domain-containing protein [Vicinamibacterales bacterium]